MKIVIVEIPKPVVVMTLMRLVVVVLMAVLLVVNALLLMMLMVMVRLETYKSSFTSHRRPNEYKIFPAFGPFKNNFLP